MKEDRLAREQQALSSEVRFRAFLNAVFDAYYDWHVETGSIELSDQMGVLLRDEPEDLPRTADDWMVRVHPEDREAIVLNDQRVLGQGGVFEAEYRMRCGDGRYIFVRDRGVVLKDEAGRSTHMIGALRDVTRQREVERAQREATELYQALFAQAVSPAYHIAEDGRFLDANEAGLAFLDIDRARLLRENAEALWGPEAAGAIRSLLATGGEAATLELELHLGAEPRSLVVTLVPCRLGGQTCFALGADITEHRALQRALEASGESLRRQASALEDANTALRVILERRNQDREDLERSVVLNAETTILPLLEQLRRRLALSPEAIYADAAIHNLKELVAPFASSVDALVDGTTRLSVREREIANLIKAGKTSSEIAEALVISPTTVAFHRRNLRRKLGLGPHDPWLGAHLARLPARDSTRTADDPPPGGASPAHAD